MVNFFSTALKFHAGTESLLDNVVSGIICKEGGVSNDLGSLIKELNSLFSSMKSIGTFYNSSMKSRAKWWSVYGDWTFTWSFFTASKQLYLLQKEQDNLKHFNLIKSRTLSSSVACTNIHFLTFSVCTQVPASIPSHECLAINGRIYTVLKQIGSGGSSKVRCSFILLGNHSFIQ